MVPALQTLRGPWSSERWRERPKATEEERRELELKPWPAFEPVPFSLSACALRCLPPGDAAFSSALFGDNTRGRPTTPASRSGAHGPKEPTHRLCKRVVPQDGGRRVVVLAAVDDHHHREGQGLQGHGTRAEPPWAARPSPALHFPRRHSCVLPASAHVASDPEGERLQGPCDCAPPARSQTFCLW